MKTDRMNTSFWSGQLGRSDMLRMEADLEL